MRVSCGTSELVWIIVIAIYTRESSTLRDVRVKIPHTPQRGQKITLKCQYDIEDDKLYSVKWYKGRREFYSYTPNEKPAIKVFHISGVRVDNLNFPLSVSQIREFENNNSSISINAFGLEIRESGTISHQINFKIQYQSAHKTQRVSRKPLMSMTEQFRHIQPLQIFTFATSREHSIEMSKSVMLNTHKPTTVIINVYIKRLTSNETQLVLESTSMATAGKYSCEVSADAPSFHTLIATAQLDIVELPRNPPLIVGIRPRYHYGNILRGNCTSRHSKPAANLTWTVNNNEVQLSHVLQYKTQKDARNEMQTSILGLHFVISKNHFENGKLKIRCIAKIGDIYHKSSEKTVLDSKYHNTYVSKSTVNMLNEDPEYNQYSLKDTEIVEKNNNLFTEMQDFFYNLIPSTDAKLSAWASASCLTTPCNLTKYSVNFFIIQMLYEWWHFYSCFVSFS